MLEVRPRIPLRFLFFNNFQRDVINLFPSFFPIFNWIDSTQIASPRLVSTTSIASKRRRDAFLVTHDLYIHEDIVGTTNFTKQIGAKKNGEGRISSSRAFRIILSSIFSWNLAEPRIKKCPAIEWKWKPPVGLLCVYISIFLWYATFAIEFATGCSVGSATGVELGSPHPRYSANKNKLSPSRG